MYVNYSHQGLYNFSEIINAQFLNLNSSHAVLYKAFGLDNQTTLFYTYSSNAPNYEIWDGWEQKYPDPRNKINWQPLAALRDAAVNKNDDEFSSIIGSIVNIDDFVDYYLFVNLIRGEDNVAKNNFLLKKSASDKLTILPWDTDFTWGYGWPATYTGYNDVISNNLFNRLVTLNAGGFKDKLKTRWFFLRNSFLNEAWLKQHFTNCYTMLYPSGIWEIENRKWNLNLKPGDEQLFVDTWITNRVAFLDQYISSL